MTDASGLYLFVMRSSFVLLALCILLVNLLPFQTLPRGWGGPDLLFGFALAWSARRPEFVPILLLAALFLLADFLQQRPPGLGAAVMLVAAADLRGRARSMRAAGFPAEWARAAGLITAAAAVQYVVLLVLLIDVPRIAPLIVQTLLTALCYPLCVLLSAAVLGVRMAAPGDMDSLGPRI